ncbi:hypothetical protein N7493_011497 [Penicillium malachiteum]|uniref:Uncharacterized protein n=1 Tax=Penicillium malachiteum TaxID=1324776 RepID=A0AAD6HAW5_9EURO|nr:hypothetical protein N7493_011497 [Penicillium malachiteum]
MEQPLPNIASPDQPIWSNFLGANPMQSPLNGTGNAFIASGSARQRNVGNITTTFTGGIEKVEAHYHATAIAKFNITESASNYPDAAADVTSIKSELSELEKVLELLNSESDERVNIPESLRTHVMTVLDNCKTVLSQINQLLENNAEGVESSKPSGWEHEMAAIRMYLNSLSSYAESVCDDAVQFPDLSDVSYSSSQPLSEIFESLSSNLSTISDARPARKGGDDTENHNEEPQATTLRTSTLAQRDSQEAPTNQKDVDLKLIAPWDDWIRFEHLPPSKLNLQRAPSDSKKNTKEMIATPAIRHSPPPVMLEIKQTSPDPNDNDSRPISWEDWTGFENIQPIVLNNWGRSIESRHFKLKLVIAGDPLCGKTGIVMYVPKLYPLNE